VPPEPRTERELAQESVIAVGQILSNYQAALHLFEEAVAGFVASVPRGPALEALQRVAREVFDPVLEACAGVAPGLDELVTESMASADDASAVDARALVIAERRRVAATHSRLIRRQPGLVSAAEEGAGQAALGAAAERLAALETGSHSAGALFNLLFERWKDLLRGRA
jgi:hypothetical protein